MRILTLFWVKTMLVYFNVEEETDVDSLFEFLKEFGLMETFFKDENLKDWEDWNYPETDQDVIERYLKKMPDTYTLVTNVDSHNDIYFTIRKLNQPLIAEEKKP